MEQREIKHTWLEVDGLRIHCLLAGEHGSALVLLHGGGTDSASLSWGEVIGPLKDQSPKKVNALTHARNIFILPLL